MSTARAQEDRRHRSRANRTERHASLMKQARSAEAQLTVSCDYIRSMARTASEAQIRDWAKRIARMAEERDPE